MMSVTVTHVHGAVGSKQNRPSCQVAGQSKAAYKKHVKTRKYLASPPRSAGDEAVVRAPRAWATMLCGAKAHVCQ